MHEIKLFENVKINKEMYGYPDAVSDTASGWPYISFFRFDFLKSLYLCQN